MHNIQKQKSNNFNLTMQVKLTIKKAALKHLNAQKGVVLLGVLTFLVRGSLHTAIGWNDQ